MASMADEMKTEEMSILKELQNQTGVKKPIHTGLWHACAGPLVSLPQLGALVYYFPQGHIEQVAISTKGSATSQVPNYSNLQPQLVCQVHTVTMHADKDTDEIFAQMSLQPIKSDKDVLPIPDFSPNHSKHPTEFFCKTLTASDTSTHGGFSVPRRAAEKLFPPLDYSMQPPSQELIVRDLHDNTWTFRHIYRGQPKRHLLTTGWSIFVSSKRLRSGDSVLFIRDEKSQLMIGVRRAKRQQTTLPSSVLSTDSMHIGVLAAAAHADANRSPFTIFYNPRACPSDFVIPINKYHKAVHGTQIALGMRFGMMFETEDSGKRRYMGTIVGTSDLDPLRWPGSKWRSLQVEWDEPGCSDKPNRVSPWEIETPESLFLFPSLTSGFKRHFLPGHMGGEFEWGNLMKKPLIPATENGYASLPYPSIPNLYSDQLMKMLLRPQTITMQSKPQLMSSSIDNNAFVNPSPPAHGSLPINEPQSNKTNTNQTQSSVSVTQDKAEGVDLVETEVVEVVNNQHNIVNQTPPSMDVANFPQTDVPEWLPCTTFQSLPGFLPPPSPLPVYGNQELWNQQLSDKDVSQAHQDPLYVQCEPSMNGLVVDISDDANAQSEIYSCLDFDAAFHYSTDCLVGNFGSSQDLQSQITSASLADSQAFSIKDFNENSVVTSSSNVDIDESSLLRNRSWQQVNPPMRTYTKVQKVGSVGRSIDVTSFRNYGDLRSGIERMFGLDGLLNDPRGSGWRLVYVDFENDVLLVGDDPWEEFVSCVRCIRILSPAEVQQMSKEGVQLLDANTTQEIHSS